MFLVFPSSRLQLQRYFTINLIKLVRKFKICDAVLILIQRSESPGRVKTQALVRGFEVLERGFSAD